MPLSIIILAAGQGTRMRSNVPKVLHRISGKPMIHHILDAASKLEGKITVVLNHQYETVKKAIEEEYSEISFHRQDASVKIDSFPITTHLGNDTILCKGSPLKLQTGFTNATHYNWSTGDTTPSINIYTDGTYTVSVTDTLGCFATDTIIINIHGQSPVVDFSWKNICLNDSTLFTDNSYTIDGSHIISWQWLSNDSVFGITQNPLYQFPSQDTFHISLLIKTDSNCTNEISKSLIIHPLPHADFSHSQACHKQAITFTNTSSSIDSISPFQWIFNHLDTIISPSTSYLFDTTGTYPVSFFVETAFGCSDTIIKDIEIKESPLPHFTYTNPCEKTPVYFTDKTTITPTFSLISWHWNFGDGVVSSLKSPNHQYDTIGTDTVILTTQSVDGCSASDTQIVTIQARPKTSFTPPHLCTQTPTPFINTSTISTSDSITDFSWYINHTFQSSITNPYFSFADSGYYSIRLISSSSHTCRDTLDTSLFAAPRPTASFTFSPSYPTPNEPITFTTDTFLNYFWTFNHVATDNQNTPTFAFSDTGNFTTQLIIENTYQCFDTTSKNIHVVPSYYDLVLYTFSADKYNDYLSFKTSVINASPKPVFGFNLILSLQGVAPLKEFIADTLLPNAVKTYNLSAQYNIATGRVPDFICLEAQLIGNIDNQPDNNKQCIALSNDFDLFSPYPNPTDSKLTLRFVLPQHDTYQLSLFDRNGKLCWQTQADGQQGLNTFFLDMSPFEAGSYTFILRFKNLSKKQQIIKK